MTTRINRRRRHKRHKSRTAAAWAVWHHMPAAWRTCELHLHELVRAFNATSIATLCEYLKPSNQTKPTWSLAESQQETDR